jgi:beta-lactamase regulating signal transducer with metallopeptidase domain
MLAWACRRDAAAVRYWIWFAASVKFLVPLSALQQLGDSLGRSLPEPLPAYPALAETASFIFIPEVTRGSTIAEALPSQLVTAIVAVWILGSAALCVRWFAQWRSIRSALKSAPLAAIDGPAPVHVARDDVTSGVFGVFRPVVLLPRRLMRALSEKQLRAILAHEACHIHRRDNLTAAIHRCVEVIFWFYPPVWWIGANLLREREAACDESVLEEGHEPVTYAESILSACRLGVAARRTAVAASTGGDLSQRLRSIMSERSVQPISSARFTLLFATSILVYLIPIVAGIAAGARSEAGDSSPVTFDGITLELSQPGAQRSAHFDPTGRLVVKNYSLRELISAAYPSARVSGPAAIDNARYDIEARWRENGRTSKRKLYRQVLEQVLRTNSNLELHVIDRLSYTRIRIDT